MRMFFTVLISVLASSTATYAETLSADKIKSDIIGKIMCVDTKSGRACARHNADGTSQIISGPHPAKVFAGIRCAGVRKTMASDFPVMEYAGDVSHAECSVISFDRA